MLLSNVSLLEISISSGLVAGRGRTSSICSCSFRGIILIKQVEELINVKVNYLPWKEVFPVYSREKRTATKFLRKHTKKNPQNYIKQNIQQMILNAKLRTRMQLQSTPLKDIKQKQNVKPHHHHH